MDELREALRKDSAFVRQREAHDCSTVFQLVVLFNRPGVRIKVVLMHASAVNPWHVLIAHVHPEVRKYSAEPLTGQLVRAGDI